ncbi:hypothetical protein [Chitinophaga sp.]|uniref:hypothetical protein n=1 Tax=Chitinophaga sp. TaxID=1869181 RepID=UPI0031DD3152
MYKVKSPILFLVFNRLDTTSRVLEAIAAAQPARLYVACDGPRSNRNEDEKVAAVRNWITQHVNWPCEVFTLFREQNLGCKQAVSSAITWFFEQEEEGIVLEDDCLPNESFFRYCDHNLEKYRDDERMMHIGGTNFQDGQQRGDGSYYFSKVCHVWGWASWRRAWKHYDITMSALDQVLERKLLEGIVPQKEYRDRWQDAFVSVKENRVNTWDYQWVFAVWNANGVSITPNVNMISNIGFDEQATHTFDKDSIFANCPTAEIGNIKVPTSSMVDNIADAYVMHGMFPKRNEIKEFAYKIYSGLKKKLK